MFNTLEAYERRLASAVECYENIEWWTKAAERCTTDTGREQCEQWIAQKRQWASDWIVAAEAMLVNGIADPLLS